MIPDAIELHKKSRQLELHYSGAPSTRFLLDAEYLRVYSPSAEVRGHHPSQAVLQHGKQQVAIVSINTVGNYALQIVFDDEHNSGIYSWDYLFELGQNHAEYWQRYLKQLDDAGKSRDPQVQVINLFEPTPKS